VSFLSLGVFAGKTLTTAKCPFAFAHTRYLIGWRIIVV
jgi:hypothetical protein